LTYYNKYNKQLVNDDNNGERYSRGNSFNFNSSSGRIHNYSGLSYGLSFFFDRRQYHYKIINDSIFSHLINLKNNYDKSNLFGYIRLNELGNLNKIVYEDAMKHLKKHNRDLPQKIKEVQPKIKEHNLKVDELYKLIENFIDNNFKRDNNSVYRFFLNNIKIQLKEIWFSSIQDIKDITNIIKINEFIYEKFRESTIEYTDDDTILNINSHAIGNGDYSFLLAFCISVNHLFSPSISIPHFSAGVFPFNT
jgi:hypothetical protein